MRAPDAQPPPGEGDGADDAVSGGLDKRIVARSSDTERWTLPYEPEAAARTIIELTGGKTLAWRWLSAVMKQVDR